MSDNSEPMKDLRAFVQMWITDNYMWTKEAIKKLAQMIEELADETD